MCLGESSSLVAHHSPGPSDGDDVVVGPMRAVASSCPSVASTHREDAEVVECALRVPNALSGGHNLRPYVGSGRSRASPVR
jgi:hypothetical protein